MSAEKFDVLEDLQAKRIHMYTKFIKLYGESIVTKKIDVRELTEFNMKTALIGGDSVLKNLLEWQKVQQKAVKTKDMTPVLVQLGKVFLEMRRELNPLTELGIKDILRSFIRDLDAQPQLLRLIDEVESKPNE